MQLSGTRPWMPRWPLSPKDKHGSLLNSLKDISMCASNGLSKWSRMSMVTSSASKHALLPKGSLKRAHKTLWTICTHEWLHKCEANHCCREETPSHATWCGNAFLYGGKDATIFTKQLGGYKDDINPSWKLIKSLYGPKQSPRMWYNCLSEAVTKHGFQKSFNNRALFMNINDTHMASSSKEENENASPCFKMISPSPLCMTPLNPCWWMSSLTWKRGNSP